MFLTERDKRIYKLSSTKLNPRSRFEDRGSKIPRGVQQYNGLYGEAPPKRGSFSGFRYMKGYIFHLLKYRGKKICHLGR